MIAATLPAMTRGTRVSALLALSVLACAQAYEAGEEPEPPPGTGDSSDDIGGDPPAVCETSFEVERQSLDPHPDILLVVDRSFSMEDDGKWQIMKYALEILLDDLGDEARFGLMLFPWESSCGRGRVRVDVGDDTAEMIEYEMDRVGPAGKTPIRKSLDEARAHFQNTAENPDGRYVLLATDGIPTCSDGDDSVEEAQKLMADGIPTYVLGFGSGATNQSILRRIAEAGGTNDYLRATSSGDLVDALSSIVAEVSVVRCEYALSQVPTDPGTMRVRFDDTMLDSSEVDGWTYRAEDNTVVFNGAACEQIRDGSVDQVTVELGCPPVL